MTVIEIPLGDLMAGVAVLENILVLALVHELARWQRERMTDVLPEFWEEHRAFVAGVVVTRIRSVAFGGSGGR